MTAPFPSAPEAPRNLFRAVIANASVLLSGRLANAVISLSYTALAARALGIHDFGILVLVHAFVQVVKDIAGFQSWQVVLYYGTKPATDGHISLFQQVLRFSLLLDGLGAIAGVAIALGCVSLIGPQLGWPMEQSPGFLLYVTVILFMASATPTGILRLCDRFDLLAIQGGIASAVRLTGAAVLYVVEAPLLAFLAVWYFAELVAGFALYGFAFRELHKRLWLKGFRLFSGPLTKDLAGIWRFCFSTNFNMTLSLAFNQVGILVVGWFLGPGEAALYRVARQIGNAIVKPASIVTQALYPELARLWASGSLKGLYRLAGQISLAAGAVASLLFLVAAFGGELILGLVMGAEYIAAAPVMVWIVAAAVISIWSLPLEPLLISTGHATAAMVTQAVVVVVYLPLLCLALQHIGLIGSGYAIVLAQALLVIVRGLFVLHLRLGHHRS